MKKLFSLLLVLLPAFVHAQVRNVMAQYPIDKPSMANLVEGVTGNWKFKEDTNKNNFYEIIIGKPYAGDRYHIKFWDRGGTNPTYESNLHFSKIGHTLFINVPYFEGDFVHKGYFFLKILNISPDHTNITAAMVHDTNLWNLSEEEVKQHIAKNMNNPAYYSDTIHLYKVK